MANVGINFFSTGQKTKIKLVNLNDVEFNKEMFEALLGLTLETEPVAQFAYEKLDDGTKERYGDPLGGKSFFSFKASEAIEVLEKNGKDASLWKKLDQDLQCDIISTACEVVE